MKKERRAARELALNILYQSDAAGVPFEEALQTAMEFDQFDEFDGDLELDAEIVESAKEYAKVLAEGTHNKSKELDGIIEDLSESWTIARQPAVDRNIIRLALYEMLYIDFVPEFVSIDEAIELAKKYSTEDSGKFVNGILGAYVRLLMQKGLEEEKDGSKNT